MGQARTPAGKQVPRAGCVWPGALNHYYFSRPRSGGTDPVALGGAGFSDTYSAAGKAMPTCRGQVGGGKRPYPAQAAGECISLQGAGRKKFETATGLWPHRFLAYPLHVPLTFKCVSLATTFEGLHYMYRLSLIKEPANMFSVLPRQR